MVRSPESSRKWTVNWRHARNAGLAGLTLFSVGVPLWNYKNSELFFSRRTECTGNIVGDYDAVAVASGGIMQNDEGRMVPNSSSTRRLTAAGIWIVDYVHSGKSLPTVWLLDGQTELKDRFVERDFLQQIIKEYSHSSVVLPNENILLDSALNTSQSAEHFGQGFRTMKKTKAALFTDNAHAGRFLMLTCANDVPAASIDIEQELISHDKTGTEAASIMAWINSPATQEKYHAEWWKRLSLLWFPQGEHLTTMKQIRNWWHDTQLFKTIHLYTASTEKPQKKESQDPDE